jgi:UDP-N-acetylglucosamine 2-epimerase (non-hydrolysing)
MKEVVTYYRPGVERSDIRSTLGLRAGEYLVVSAHREENVDQPELLRALLVTLDRLAATYRLPVIVSTHPRTRGRLEDLRRDEAAAPLDERVRFCRPFGFFDYVALQRDARCVVSDSGTITEESSLLGFPAVTIRAAHERPEGMDHGVLVSSILHPDRVLAAVELMTTPNRRRPRVVPDDDVDDVSRRILHIIMSYVDNVRRTVWYERSPLLS